MAKVAPPRPLSEDDERDHFDCGRDSLNSWFRRNAWHNHMSGISRTSVICDTSTKLIVGYVTLSAAQIERQFLPKTHRRNKPDPVPATLLGQGRACFVGVSWEETGARSERHSTSRNPLSISCWCRR